MNNGKYVGGVLKWYHTQVVCFWMIKVWNLLLNSNYQTDERHFERLEIRWDHPRILGIF